MSLEASHRSDPPPQVVCSSIAGVQEIHCISCWVCRNMLHMKRLGKHIEK